MNRFRRLAASTFVAVVLASLVGPVAAAPPPPDPPGGLGTAGCTHYIGAGAGSPVYVKFYEQADWNAGWKVLCVRVSGASVEPWNLKDYSSTLPGTPINCRIQLPSSNGTWNDCVSSYRYSLYCALRLHLYKDAGWINEFSVSPNIGPVAGQYTFGLGNMNDVLSSFRLEYNLSWC